MSAMEKILFLNLTLFLLTIQFVYSEKPLHKSNDRNESKDTLEITVEEIDTLHSWTSPLFGHHAPKMGMTKDGAFYVSKFSGDYPNGDVDILEKKDEGFWTIKKKLTGVYQPSLLFVDDEDHINILQNSQTEPVLHLRSKKSGQPSSFDTIAKGNGLSDGRGWYVGGGIYEKKIYMSYVTLSYDLFLTWKYIGDSVWNTPIVIHRGSIDPNIGNHSWTRPKFDFYGDYGYFVVNETSDGSVRNTYNAVVMVKFLLTNPLQFETEYIGKVPLGYTAFSTDFSISQKGQIVCVYQIGKKVYDSGKNEKAPEMGLYVGLRHTGKGKWKNIRLFEKERSREAAIIFGRDNSVCILQMDSKGYKETTDLPQENAVFGWKARISHDDGVHWNDVVIKGSNIQFINPTHLELMRNRQQVFGKISGLFDDLMPANQNSKMRFYHLYAIHAELK